MKDSSSKRMYMVNNRPNNATCTYQRKKQQGVALITVMLIVALAAILVTQMTGKLQLQMQRVSNIESNQQAYWYAMGAEAFAKRVLIMSFDGQTTKTHLGQIWAQGESSYPIDYGQITGEINDLQSCFNLNALREGGSTQNTNVPNNNQNPTNSNTNTSSSTGAPHQVAKKSLERLIVKLNIDNVSAFEAKDMVDALSDWLDDDSQVTNSGGAEDSDYESKEHPYLAANHYLGNIKELRTITHFTTPIINALKPYVCVIPNTSLHKVNINTVGADNIELVTALLDISSSEADEIISSRGVEGYNSIDDVFTLPGLAKANLTQEQKDQLVIDSEYFSLKAHTNFNNSYFFLSSIMKVESNNQISIISRTIGRD